MSKKIDDWKTINELKTELDQKIKKFNKKNKNYFALRRRSGDDNCIQILRLPGFDSLQHIMNVRSSEIYLVGECAIVGSAALEFAVKTHKLMAKISAIERSKRNEQRGLEGIHGDDLAKIEAKWPELPPELPDGPIVKY